MSSVVIRTESLSKQYRLGSRRNTTLRDTVAEWPRRAGARMTRRGKSALPKTIWALDNVSIDIDEGELVGIVGRNGAGKSTLLKILSRITEPTSGRARLKGRVGSLLEVGTGFHPELTGRENVFLSGSILGMRRNEIQQRFDAIVDFAEIDEFLDTPVKRFSSGMQVRLAFAVAAHLEPEIMLVDEVLAVGDVAFQRKCLGRMGDVAREGRTVIFVSHNLAVLQALCRRGVLIEHGQVEEDGSIGDCVSLYLQKLEQAATQTLSERQDARGWHQYRVTSVDIRSNNAQTPSLLRTGEPAHFVFHCTEMVPSMTCAFTISNQLGHPVAEFKSAVGGPLDGVDRDLDRCFVCYVDALPLVPGRYRLDFELRARGVEQHLLEGAAIFQVEPGVMEGRAVDSGSRGSTAVAHRWMRSPG